MKNNESLMKVYMSKLFRLGKEYIGYERYKLEDFNSDRYLLLELKE